MIGRALSVTVGLAILGCITTEKKSADQISGTYAREYSFKVNNPESRDEIGMRTIRDTIFVRVVQEGFEVSNSKWQKNDYDTEGWRSMIHSEDRPMPTYLATYADGRLNPQQPGLAPILYTDPSNQTISKSPDKTQPYQKVK
jgi:hypothetical protein